jgi:hypothetical protein
MPDKYIFEYKDNLGKLHKITMRRAEPEWCNHDCPMITYTANDGFPMRINVAGWIGDIENGVPDDVAVLYARFVLTSSRAWYRKFPQYYKDSNHFWTNFVADLRYLRGDDYCNHILRRVGNKDKE